MASTRRSSQSTEPTGPSIGGFQIIRGRIIWTDKALQRFEQRIWEIISRSQGVSTFKVLTGLTGLTGLGAAPALMDGTAALR